MERLSAEGLFFHRSCFQCSSCGSTLRAGAYAYDRLHRRFYCLQHRASSSRVSSSAPLDSAAPRPSAGALTPSVAPVMVATSERMELEEHHRSSTKMETEEAYKEPEEVFKEPKEVFKEPEEVYEEPEEAFKEPEEVFMDPEEVFMEPKEVFMEPKEVFKEPEEVSEEREEVYEEHEVVYEEAEEAFEVPEETLNRFNLSVEEIQQYGSSESEMEEEEEEEEEEQEEEEEGEEGEEGQGHHHRVTSEEAKASRRETLQQHLHLGNEEEEEEEESSDEEESRPLVSQSVSSAAGSDITHCDTPSTASFITTSDSAPDEDGDTAPASPVQRQPAGGRGSFDDINKPLPLHDREAGSEKEEAGSKSRGPRGALSLPRVFLPPLQGGGGALLQLKGPRQAEGGGPRTLWGSVFSGNRKEKKKNNKRGVTLPLGAEKDAANHMRATDVRGGPAEESDLDSSALLQRCSRKPENNLRLDSPDLASEVQRVTMTEEEQNQEPAYVPHALAFKRAYGAKKRSLKHRSPLQGSGGQSCPTEVVGVLVQPKEPSSLGVKETMFQRGPEDQDLDEDLDAKITRRVQRAARRKAKQEQLKRLHKAQVIQRQLQQVEEKLRRLEERGVMVERALRGEADYWGDTTDSQNIELHLEGLGKLGNPALMQQWFQLVQEKNSLVRYESELMIFARELELEDRQGRLQQELRERMAVDDHLKEARELLEERLILEEMLEVVEQRDSLVSLLEEQRLQQRQEDQNLEEVQMSQGLGLNWT